LENLYEKVQEVYRRSTTHKRRGKIKIMSLIVSDLHGDLSKLKAFLAYRPEEEHIHAGDICDDWTAPDKQVEDTIKLCFAKKSNMIQIVGNHDLCYMAYPPFQCSGHRWNAEKTYDLIRKHEKKFKMAIVRDGFLITHAGVDEWFLKEGRTEIEDIANYIEGEWQRWLISDRNPSFWKTQDIFWISRISGGSSEFGGPLWARPGFDAIDRSYSQVFGHTERRELKWEYFNPESNIMHVNTDCKVYACFNTKTRQFEKFGHGMTTTMFEQMKGI